MRGFFPFDNTQFTRRKTAWIRYPGFPEFAFVMRVLANNDKKGL